jgi:dipeptidase D
MIFDNLEPKTIWKYFAEICKVPRPSKLEEKMITYVVHFAEKHHLEVLTDGTGNVLIKKPASKGKQMLQTIVLQSHLDMVCEKNNDTHHHFETDAIQPYVDGNWVKAKGTTLGADDGIGVAAMLAVLGSGDIEHGPLECLFTVDEESGLTGAFELQKDFLTGKILVNLDSEDEGEIFIGCAGGIDTTATFSFERENVPANSTALIVTVKGLTGGHSGDDIEKQRGNSIKILNRILWNLSNKYHARVHSFMGGNLKNAIPREAFALITLPIEHKDNILEYIQKFSSTVRSELIVSEPGITIIVREADLPAYVIDKETQDKLVRAVYACPHGVISWSQQIKGFVETSTNLAAIKMEGDGLIHVITSQRSSVDSLKEDICNRIESVFKLAGAEVAHGAGYPGWAPNINSEILNITVDAYKKRFGKNPIVRAIHAGLECGLFLEKYPGLDMVSFGPTIKGAHSPEERLDIESTMKFWDLLLDVMKNIPLEKAPTEQL